MDARNMAMPAMAACQLFHKLRGRTTREAPATASRTRKANQLRRSRRRFRSLGRSRTTAKSAPNAKLRSRATTVSSCWEATGVVVVLITLRSSAVQCFSTARGKNKTNSLEAAVRVSGFEAVDFAHAIQGPAHMRGRDRAAYDEGVSDLFP